MSALPSRDRAIRALPASGMTRFEAWFVHGANVVVAVTGIGYGVFRYFVKPSDPYALVHPWQSSWQHLHVLAAPALIFGIGLVWRHHAWRLLRSGLSARRRTGWILIAAAVPMIASGYLLQTSVDPTWRSLWMWTHVGLSVAWMSAYAGHQLAAVVSGLRSRRSSMRMRDTSDPDAGSDPAATLGSPSRTGS